MDRFAVRYDAIDEAQQSVQRAGETVAAELDTLDQVLGPLRARWTGEAAASFDAARAQWRRSGQAMADVLDQIAKLLSRIDENYRNAHQANLAIWGGGSLLAGPASTAAMAAAPAGGAGEVDVSIEELRRAARSFHGLRQRLADSMSWISRDLHNMCSGMAGSDPVLAYWRSRYDVVVEALWKVLMAATDMLGGIAQGMTETGNNYVDSEAASIMGHGEAPPERLPQLDVHSVRPHPEPPPAQSTTPPGRPDWTYEFWPDGEPEKLSYAANEWANLGRILTEVSNAGDGLIHELVEGNHGEVFDGIAEYWESKFQLCGSSQSFSILESTCRMLSTGCRDLARAVRNAQNGMRGLADSTGDTDIFDIIGLFPSPWAKGISLIGEAAEWIGTGAKAWNISTRYTTERQQAEQDLSGNEELLTNLGLWTVREDEISVESARRAYAQADQGLEQYLDNDPYTGWDAVSGPHPDPASVHITDEDDVHILYGGPPPRKGGGHLSGTGQPGKTEFPPGWDAALIRNEVKSVAHDPDQPPVMKGNGGWELYGTRYGILIKVNLDDDGRVRSAYPLAGPGVDRNPRKG